MELTLKKELPLIAIVILPFIYLAYIWNSLPEKVPLHWNAKGEIDRYGDKIELAIIPILLPLFIYALLVVIPRIDPKNKLHKMGNKYHTIKIFITTFMSILAIFILYSSKNQSFTNPNYTILLIGILFIILGNFFKTIKSNYFIGIRTPWTLENETVWKKTHELGGKMWFIGGLMIVLSSMIFDKKINTTIFLIITTIITLTPVIYSYTSFKSLQKTS